MSPTKSNTVIGCLSGPNADNLYRLSSMQYRTGLEVTGDADLKNAIGAKVKLSGSWESLPGKAGTTGDAARRFKATGVVILSDTCHAPSPTQPAGKSQQPKK